MAHCPNADREKHRSEDDTAKYCLFTVVVRDQEETLEVAREVDANKDLDSILLCPGFTQMEVAELFDALGALEGSGSTSHAGARGLGAWGVSGGFCVPG